MDALKPCQWNWKIVSERDAPLAITCYVSACWVKYRSTAMQGMHTIDWEFVSLGKAKWPLCVHLMGHVNSTPGWLWSGQLNWSPFILHSKYFRLNQVKVWHEWYFFKHPIIFTTLWPNISVILETDSIRWTLVIMCIGLNLSRSSLNKENLLEQVCLMQYILEAENGKVSSMLEWLRVSSCLQNHGLLQCMQGHGWVLLANFALASYK